MDKKQYIKAYANVKTEDEKRKLCDEFCKEHAIFRGNDKISIKKETLFIDRVIVTESGIISYSLKDRFGKPYNNGIFMTQNNIIITLDEADFSDSDDGRLVDYELFEGGAGI